VLRARPSAYTEGDIQRGSPQVASPATCPDRQGAIAPSRADVVTASDNEWIQPSVFGSWVSRPKEMPMSNAPRFSDLNLSRSRFRDHPDSIAEPLRRRRLEAT
jgi:hypothetical protein